MMMNKIVKPSELNVGDTFIAPVTNVNVSITEISHVDEEYCIVGELVVPQSNGRFSTTDQLITIPLDDDYDKVQLIK